MNNKDTMPKFINAIKNNNKNHNNKNKIKIYLFSLIVDSELIQEKSVF